MVDQNTFTYIKYMADFGKSHMDMHDFKQRLANFMELDQWIEEHNASGASWVAGHNQFSDWHRSEYKKMLGLKSDEDIVRQPTVYEETNASYINWIEKGAVTPVKDQGYCGSCWAFSATGALEGAYYLQTGELETFSEQQLVSCVTQSYGCGGGWQYRAFEYWINYNAELSSVYPYYSYYGQNYTCQYDYSSKTAKGVAS